MRAICLMVVLVLAGCGNYSNDDIAFLDALPSREALAVSVPQNGGALGLQASLYTGTVQSAQSIDGAVLQLVEILDLVRTLPPSSRARDGRTWGPFRDRDPRFENQVSITRTGVDSYAYAFGQRRTGVGAFGVVLTGTFVGASAATGNGTLDFDPSGLRAIGHPPADASLQGLHFRYANDVQPRRVQTTILAGALDGGTAELDYVFAQSAAEGDLDWQYEGPTPDAGRFSLRVRSRLRPDGAGRADAQGTVEALSGLEWRLTQCWDGTFIERYADSNIVRPEPDGGATPVVPGYLCLEVEGQPCPAGPPDACVF
jgi:hypothetical protein